jgi:Fe-S-cluster containining protein
MSRKTQRYIHDPSRNADWLAEGLSFACTGCGGCCTGGEGYVWVSVDEIRQLARAFELDLDGFGARYLRRVGTRYALLEDRLTGSCVFLRGKSCGVYEDRPSQCRAYPWWPEIVASPAAWKREASRCEGIDDAAPRVSAESILKALATVPESPRPLKEPRAKADAAGESVAAGRPAFESPSDRSKLKSS